MADVNFTSITIPKGGRPSSKKATVKTETAKEQNDSRTTGEKVMFNPLLAQMMALQLPLNSIGGGAQVGSVAQPSAVVSGSVVTAQNIVHNLLGGAKSAATSTPLEILFEQPTVNVPSIEQATAVETSDAKVSTMGVPVTPSVEARLAQAIDATTAGSEPKSGDSSVNPATTAVSEIVLGTKMPNQTAKIAENIPLTPRDSHHVGKPLDPIAPGMQAESITQKAANTISSPQIANAAVVGSLLQQPEDVPSIHGKRTQEASGSKKAGNQAIATSINRETPAETVTNLKRAENQTNPDQQHGQPRRDPLETKVQQARKTVLAQERSDAIKLPDGLLRVQEGGRLEVATPTPATLRTLSPELAASIRDQIANGVSLRLLNQVSEMRIALKPESLGEVVVNVRMEDNAIVARIEVNQQNVKTALDANIGQLREVLVNKGIQVDRIDVLNASTASFKESNNHPQQKGKNSTKRTDVDSGEPLESMRQLGYNTLEYLV
jgi:flagellar hook-length control protein FliK